MDVAALRQDAQAGAIARRPRASDPPHTYNIVHLARRLIASEPQIEVPAEDNEHDDDDSADKRQRWLSAFWQRTNREQRRDIIADAAWQVLVRGRTVFEVKWLSLIHI